MVRVVHVNFSRITLCENASHGSSVWVSWQHGALLRYTTHSKMSVLDSLTSMDRTIWSVVEGSLMRICDVTFGDNGGSVGLDGVVVVLLQLLLLFLLLVTIVDMLVWLG